jgi:hypothetical protein
LVGDVYGHGAIRELLTKTAGREAKKIAYYPISRLIVYEKVTIRNIDSVSISELVRILY